MSGGPPHHPHGRQAPPTNTAWNHLQVPNFFPTRQPQHAHMSNEHSMLHQPTWHTPTTEPLKTPHSHIYSLQQMLSERQFPSLAPGVDLTLTRNGNQNGDVSTPISLSVRDTNKINSLPASAIDIQPIEAKPSSPALKPPISPGLDAKKRSAKRVDSILERLNPNLEKAAPEIPEEEKGNRSVIVQAASSQDENSNSSNVATPINPREDEVVSPYSTEDSLDGGSKSRRKRKPSKTVRVTKEEVAVLINEEEEKKVDVEKKVPERRRSSDDAIIPGEVPAKTRRKTSSESETIDNIAAMVQEGLKPKEEPPVVETPKEADLEEHDSKPVTVSVIKTKDNLQESVVSDEMSDGSNNVSTTAPLPPTNPPSNQFVEVENKLEEMFAGIEDAIDPKPEQPMTSTHDNVTSTSSDLTVPKKSPKKVKRKQRAPSSEPVSPKKTKTTKKSLKSIGKTKNKKLAKIEAMRDVYAYDSGSNASSSKSRGPFIQIRGPRDSPLSVSVVNTPTNDDDDKKVQKNKKFHDDSEYRHKVVRSKGLHCSTLSNQYDAQTKDASWICAFCKRGPHATETSGPSLNVGARAPGDLFGPYFITTNCPEFERRLDDPYDKQFKSKKIVRSIDGNKIALLAKKPKRKHSFEFARSPSEDEIYRGITATASGTFEIWAHEDCIVWSAGVYLVGPKIVGLEEAVWTSCNVVCATCQLKGANICCLNRGCVRVAHVCCARLTNWQFDEGSYKTLCPEHRAQ